MSQHGCLKSRILVFVRQSTGQRKTHNSQATPPPARKNITSYLLVHASFSTILYASRIGIYERSIISMETAWIHFRTFTRKAQCAIFKVLRRPSCKKRIFCDATIQEYLFTWRFNPLPSREWSHWSLDISPASQPRRKMGNIYSHITIMASHIQNMALSLAN